MGGRTEDMVLHYAVREGDTIKYYDIMCLYTYVCKYSKFSVGHSTINVGDAFRDKQAMLSNEGLIKCIVLTPKRFYHAVLQFRCNNKLILSMQDVCSRKQIFRRMRKRIESAQVYNVNVGLLRGSSSPSKGLPGPRYNVGVQIRGEEIQTTHTHARVVYLRAI